MTERVWPLPERVVVTSLGAVMMQWRNGEDYVSLWRHEEAPHLVIYWGRGQIIPNPTQADVQRALRWLVGEVDSPVGLDADDMCLAATEMSRLRGRVAELEAENKLLREANAKLCNEAAGLMDQIERNRVPVRTHTRASFSIDPAEYTDGGSD